MLSTFFTALLAVNGCHQIGVPYEPWHITFIEIVCYWMLIKFV